MSDSEASERLSQAEQQFRTYASSTASSSDLDIHQRHRIVTNVRNIVNADSNNTSESQNTAVSSTQLNAEIVKQYHANRPQSTKNTYGGPQREYKEWCGAQGFGCCTVTGKRALQYFVTHLLKRKKKDRSGDMVGRVVFDHHMKALCDLYKLQKEVPEVNATVTAEYPRTLAVKNLMKTCERDEYEKQHDDLVDRGVGTLADGYSKDEFVKIAKYFLQMNDVKGLRNRFDHLAGHNMLLRGSSKRNMELADLLSFVLEESEGVSKCRALIAVSRNGKTNKVGRIEYAGCICSKDVNICPVGAFFLYMFARLAYEKEGYPDVFVPSSWYNIKLLKGSHREKPMCYNTQYEAIRKCFNALGIQSRKKTHANRGCGARSADMGGADESQLW